jgi:hypothetical protein
MFALSLPISPAYRTGMYANDPITWCSRERIARYREEADAFQEMAKSDERPLARDLLIRLAHEFDCLADGLQELP